MVEQSAEIVALFTEVYGNFDKLQLHLKKRFPAAYAEFNDFETDQNSFPYRFFYFFYGYEVYFKYGVANTVKPAYVGTYSFTITINREMANELGRNNLTFTQNYIATMSRVVEKLIEKAFTILEHYLTGKQIPDRIRRL